MDLLPDQRNCHANEKTYNILLGIGQNLVSIPYQTFGRHADTFGENTGVSIGQLAFNSKDSEVFVATAGASIIYMVDYLNNRNLLELVSKFIFSVTSMAYGELQLLHAQRIFNDSCSFL